MLVLYKHQKEILERNPKRHLIAFDRGTGKTLTGLLLACKNETATFGKLTYIIVPKKVKSKWQGDINNFIDQINKYIEPENKMRADSLVVMTKEEFKKNARTLPKPNAIIGDEFHYFAGLKSQLSKSFQWFIRHHNVEYLWLMTATPYLSTPWNIYTLARCLGYEINYTKWLREFFKPKYLGIKIVYVPDETKYGLLQEYVREIGTIVGIEEVVEDIPEQKDEFINVYLSDAQKEELLNVDLSNPLTGFGQKHQIENGIKKGNEYEKDKEIEDYKTIFLLDLKAQNKKVAVFARYTLQIEKYKKLFEGKGYKTLILSGKTKDAGEVIKEAVDSDDVVLIIQSQCSEGYELPNFDLCIFASLSFSYKDYIQAKGRFLRINKLKENRFIHLTTTDKKKTVDMAVLDAIQRKQDFDIGLYGRDEY